MDHHHACMHAYLPLHNARLDTSRADPAIARILNKYLHCLRHRSIMCTCTVSRDGSALAASCPHAHANAAWQVRHKHLRAQSTQFTCSFDACHSTHMPGAPALLCQCPSQICVQVCINGSSAAPAGTPHPASIRCWHSSRNPVQCESGAGMQDTRCSVVTASGGVCGPRWTSWISSCDLCRWCRSFLAYAPPGSRPLGRVLHQHLLPEPVIQPPSPGAHRQLLRRYASTTATSPCDSWAMLPNGCATLHRCI